MIGSAGVMGFGLSDLKTWSLWEYDAIITGWNEAHRDPNEDEKPEAPSIEEHRKRAKALEALINK